MRHLRHNGHAERREQSKRRSPFNSILHRRWNVVVCRQRPSAEIDGHVEFERYRCRTGNREQVQIHRAGAAAAEIVRVDFVRCPRRGPEVVVIVVLASFHNLYLVAIAGRSVDGASERCRGRGRVADGGRGIGNDGRYKAVCGDACADDLLAKCKVCRRRDAGQHLAAAGRSGRERHGSQRKRLVQPRRSAGSEVATASDGVDGLPSVKRRLIRFLPPDQPLVNAPRIPHYIQHVENGI